MMSSYFDMSGVQRYIKANGPVCLKFLNIPAIKVWMVSTFAFIQGYMVGMSFVGIGFYLVRTVY